MKKIYLIFLTAIISGFSIFINKFGVKFTNPYVFTFLKNSVVFVFLFGLILLLNEYKQFKQLKKKDWAKLITIGFIGGSVPFLLFFKGLQLTSAASGAFIHKTMFIWVALLGLIFLKEKLDKRMFIVAVLLLAGNLLLVKLSSFSVGRGELLIFGATLFWSIETILSKNALKNLDGKTVAFGRMFFGSLFILIFLVATRNFTPVLELSFTQVGWVLVTSLFLFGYVYTWYNGLKFVSSTTATCVLLLGSPVTTLLNFIYTGVISLVQVAGIMTIILGIIAAMRIKETHRISIPNPR